MAPVESCRISRKACVDSYHDPNGRCGWTPKGCRIKTGQVFQDYIKENPGSQYAKKTPKSKKRAPRAESSKKRDSRAEPSKQRATRAEPSVSRSTSKYSEAQKKAAQEKYNVFREKVKEHHNAAEDQDMVSKITDLISKIQKIELDNWEHNDIGDFSEKLKNCLNKNLPRSDR